MSSCNLQLVPVWFFATANKYREVMYTVLHMQPCPPLTLPLKIIHCWVSASEWCNLVINPAFICVFIDSKSENLFPIYYTHKSSSSSTQLYCIYCIYAFTFHGLSIYTCMHNAWLATHRTKHKTDVPCTSLNHHKCMLWYDSLYNERTEVQNPRCNKLYI